jgi:signal transduction histidine kinase
VARLKSRQAPSESWVAQPWDAVKLLAGDLGFCLADGRGDWRGGSNSLPRTKTPRTLTQVTETDLETLRVENDGLVNICRDYVEALSRAERVLGLEGFVVLSECSGVLLEVVPLQNQAPVVGPSSMAALVPGTVLSLTAAGVNPIGLALDQAAVAILPPPTHAVRRRAHGIYGLAIPLGRSPVPVGCLGILVPPRPLGIAPAVLGQALFSVRAIELALALKEERSTNLQAAASLAHEVRNPLTAVKGFLQLALTHRSEVSEYSGLALRELDRAISLLEDYSLLSRTPRMVPDQELKVDGLMSDAALLARGMVGSGPTVTIDYRHSAPGLALLGDPPRLKQVLLNLCRNAIEAMPAGGLLTLRARRQDGEVVLEVSDTGVGIPADALERVFEPFYTTKEAGTGLGLAVCRRIVEAHGGRLSIRSQPDRGTTIQVHLPLHRPAEGEPPV